MSALGLKAAVPQQWQLRSKMALCRPSLHPAQMSAERTFQPFAFVKSTSAFSPSPLSIAPLLFRNFRRLCENSEFGHFWCRSFSVIDLFLAQLDERGHKFGNLRYFSVSPIVFTQPLRIAAIGAKCRIPCNEELQGVQTN